MQLFLLAFSPGAFFGGSGPTSRVGVTVSDSLFAVRWDSGPSSYFIPAATVVEVVGTTILLVMVKVFGLGALFCFWRWAPQATVSLNLTQALHNMVESTIWDMHVFSASVFFCKYVGYGVVYSLYLLLLGKFNEVAVQGSAPQMVWSGFPGDGAGLQGAAAALGSRGGRGRGQGVWLDWDPTTLPNIRREKKRPRNRK